MSHICIGGVTSKCINCDVRRACVIIEMRAQDGQGFYKLSGPMLEVCHECLKDAIVQRSVVVSLVESL